MITALTTALPFAAETAGAAEEESGNFLVSPELGLMIWTLIAFLTTLYILKKLAFPRIQEALDKRQRAIEEAIDHASRAKEEADALLSDYRQRLTEAREQAEEIVARAQKAGEAHERKSLEDARNQREEILAGAKRDIEAETRRAISEIRGEVADLTVMATEKVTRKSLSQEDQERLVEEALSELDFSALAGEGTKG